MYMNVPIKTSYYDRKPAYSGNMFRDSMFMFMSCCKREQVGARPKE